MVKIEVNNNQCKLTCHLKSLIKLRNLTRIRHPNAYWLRVKGSVQKGWDGFVYPITEAGRFDTGLLPMVYDLIKKELKLDVKFIDHRDYLEAQVIPHKLGEFEARKYQKRATRSITNNFIQDLYFPRGMVYAATNAGKTLVSALIHLSFNKRTAFFVNSTELFNDAIEEISKMLPGKVGFISSKKIEWNDFMICMVPTLNNRMGLIMNKLSEFEVLIVDECDLASSKSYSKVIKHMFNSQVRVGLSGSIGTGKDKLKNLTVHKFFGSITYRITNEELIDLGFSSKVEVQILTGNRSFRFNGDYRLEYEKGIIKNKTRNDRIVKEVANDYREGRLPILIITPRHHHVDILYSKIMKELGAVLRVSSVHHKTPERKQIVKDFKDGKIDILVGSHILKRGKNFPLMRVMVNAGGGDAASIVLQLLGRAMRFHELKDKTIVKDFWDKGKYLRTHSYHRLNTYKGEHIPIREIFKDTIKKKNAEKKK